ncbi:hypothetical protein C8R48DRAFT_781076 [Suillus tomentosus]|nr:hypothetical protein C8R48DRAFT_781076 [Suillus tomentosus]
MHIKECLHTVDLEQLAPSCRPETDNRRTLTKIGAKITPCRPVKEFGLGRQRKVEEMGVAEGEDTRGRSSPGKVLPVPTVQFDDQTGNKTTKTDEDHGKRRESCENDTSDIDVEQDVVVKTSKECSTGKEPLTRGTTQPTITIKSIISHPTKQLVDEEEVEQYNDRLRARIGKLSTFSNVKAGVFALGCLLPNATWGPYKAVGDRSKTICDPMTGEPLTVWVVGHIARLWFMRQGRLENQASITVIPLSQTLAQQSAMLLAKLSKPQTVVETQQTRDIRAVKWQSTKVGGESSEPVLFDVVYDARKEGSLKNHGERPIWQNEKGRWISKAQYEMVAISLLNMSEVNEEEESKQNIEGLSIQSRT